MIINDDNGIIDNPDCRGLESCRLFFNNCDDDDDNDNNNNEY